MSTENEAAGIIDKVKNALDANGDGEVTFEEVVQAGGNRIIETAEAVAEAAGSIKDGFDANGDGKVSLDEVADVAKGVGEAAKDAAEDLVDKIKGAAKSE